MAFASSHSKTATWCACGPATAGIGRASSSPSRGHAGAAVQARHADGEAVAHCLDGLPDFHRLVGDGQATACFYAFDLLWLKAQDVRGVEAPKFRPISTRP